MKGVKVFTIKFQICIYFMVDKRMLTKTLLYKKREALNPNAPLNANIQ